MTGSCPHSITYDFTDFDADDSGAQVHVIPSDEELEAEVESIFQPGGLDQ